MRVAESAAPDKLWTAEEVASWPDDGVERSLIDGELRERPMPWRNPEHCEAVALIGRHLWNWVATQPQPQPRGRVLGGEAGFRVLRNPDTYVGVDVAYVSADAVAVQKRGRRFFEGGPALAVEILSPSDEHGDVVEKVRKYLEAGSVVWLADPDFRTVTVHRPGERR